MTRSADASHITSMRQATLRVYLQTEGTLETSSRRVIRKREAPIETETNKNGEKLQTNREARDNP